MDVEFNFKSADDSPCKCTKIRVVQIVGRFKTGNNAPAQGESVDRNAITTRAGWQIDWPTEMPPQVPFVDNVPEFANAWTPGKNGRIEDPPGLHNIGRKVTAYTCFVGEVDGKQAWYGCVKWGYKRTGKTELAADPEKPEWSCGKPEGFEDAVDAWNQKRPTPFPKNIPMP